MIVEKNHWLESVIDEHFEELQALWSLRRSRAEDREWLTADLAKLDARLAAHADALVLAYPHAQGKFQEHLAGSHEQVFAACLPLMYRSDAVALVRDCLAAATAENVIGFAFAFACAAPFAKLDQLHQTQGLSDAAMDALSIGLAIQQGKRVGPEVSQRFESPSAAASEPLSWMLLGLSSGASVAQSQLEAAEQSEDPWISDLAWDAVVRSRQPWLVEYCQTQITQRSPARLKAAEALSLIGQSSDWPLIESVITDEALGAERLKLASNTGNPGFIPILCQSMHSDDAPTMVAAKIEFHRLTGIDLSTDRLVHLAPTTATELELAFAQQEFAPDPQAALSAWQEYGDQWRSCQRMHRGQEATDAAPAGPRGDLFEHYRTNLRRVFKQQISPSTGWRFQPEAPWAIFSPD